MQIEKYKQISYTTIIAMQNGHEFHNKASKT